MRTEQGVAQETLAHKAGIERSHMGKIERGGHMPTLALIFSSGYGLGPLETVHDLCKTIVIPAKAGIQIARPVLDPGFRRDDELIFGVSRKLQPCFHEFRRSQTGS